MNKCSPVQCETFIAVENVVVLFSAAFCQTNKVLVVLLSSVSQMLSANIARRHELLLYHMVVTVPVQFSF